MNQTKRVSIYFMHKKTFSERHIGPNNTEKEAMLAELKTNSIESLITNTIPDSIQQTTPLEIQEGISEQTYLNRLTTLVSKTKHYKTWIGQGYYGTYTPTVIQRNIFEIYSKYAPK